ncbi:MAG: alcohol dehydrogenase catalytic domain-containing protein [Planctomycetales bacterium]|nr:alcohol dehydrogenase catalytic domain-containing protein [Planctomycetales bacterium]
MRAVRLVRPEPGAVEVMDVPTPKPGPGQALVRVLAAGICGTDRHIANFHPSLRATLKPPLTFGHEFCGEIEALGSGVTGLDKGEYVSCEMHEVCGRCYPCRTGRGHICRNTVIYGLHRDGCFAEKVVVPAANVVKLPREVVPPRVGAFLDALGNAVHTVLEGDVSGRTVAILGCGPIGMMAAAVAEFCGASGLFLTDVSPFALERARAWAAAREAAGVRRIPIAIHDVRGPGRAAAVESIVRDSDGGVDVALEMSGAAPAVNDGLRVLRPGGVMCALGLPGARELTLEDYGAQVIFKGITLKGIIGRKMFETWYRMLAFLRAGLDVSGLITVEAPLAEFPAAFAKFDKGEALKVVLYPHGPNGAPPKR